MSGPVSFPEEILTEIGRITVAASGLEFMLAHFAAEILSDVTADELLSRAGRVVPAAQQAADLLYPALADAFGEWIVTAQELLAERHRIVHSTWLIRAAEPGRGEYYGVHPRTGFETDPDLESIHQIAERLDQCSTDGFELIFANVTAINQWRKESHRE